MARNPILEALSGTSKTPSMQGNNPFAMMGQLKQMVGMLRGQNPQQVARMLAQKNPQFAEFLRQNQGKSPEQIASENGIDMNFVRELMR